MKQFLFAAVLVGAALFASIMLPQQDPVITAQVKCEAAIERLTSYDVSAMDVARASVVGDVVTGTVPMPFDGTVTMPFDVGGQRRLGICVFESGTTKRVTIDGKLLAGAR